MIFSIFILVALLGVAYYHYLQGAFTALISAFCALIATLIAFGYYEVLFGVLPPGKMVNFAPGLSLIVLFAVSYLVLRIIFDSVAPGNIRLPAVADKSCGAVFGIIAGLFGSGVLAVGAQYFPFGPSIGGFVRQETVDRTVIIPHGAMAGKSNDTDSHIDNELKNDNKLDPSANNALLIPSDGFVTSVAALASDGAFSGSESFTALHPNLLTELFGNRIGAETATVRVANGKSEPPATLTGVFTVPALKAADTEVTKVRPAEKALTYSPEASKVLIAVRLKFNSSATDTDNYARLTPAAAPLMFGSKVYYPIGTLANKPIIALKRIDDMIVVPVKGENNSADLVYAVDKAVFDRIVSGGIIKGNPGYVQIKLLGRIPLTGKVSVWTPTPSTEVLFKKLSPFNSTGNGGTDATKAKP